MEKSFSDSGGVALGAWGLTVRYGSLLAVDSVSFELPPGSVTGLVGPNGSGKSTLLKTLLGFLVPAGGRVEVFGLDPMATPLRFRQLIGYMPEHESFFPSLSGLDGVVYAGRLAGMPKEAAYSRAYEVLDYLGMDEVRLRPVEQYSVGLKQKIKLAQAIVHSPRLLLLDEPMGGLDPNSRDEMIRLLAGIGGAGVTIVLSSHVLHDVEQLCDRLLALQGGKVAFSGPRKRLQGRGDNAWSLRLKGDSALFMEAMAKRGIQCSVQAAGIKLVLPDESNKVIFEAALEAGVEIRELKGGDVTLEEAFLGLMGGS